MIQKVKRTVRLTRYVIYKETLIDFKEKFWSFMGSFVGIGIIAFIQSHFLNDLENVFLIGSFGASSVLVYGAIQSPMAQPRNLIGGHLVSAICGVTVAYLLNDIIWLAAPLAVATSIILMQYTRTLHPPGGATALIAIIGSDNIEKLGFFYVISPVLSGVAILYVVAMIFNNVTTGRQYPTNKSLTKVTK